MGLTVCKLSSISSNKSVSGSYCKWAFCILETVACNWEISKGQLLWTCPLKCLDNWSQVYVLRVRHDWTTSLSLFAFMHWRRERQPTPVFLPGESQGRGSLAGCRLWGRTESDTTEATWQQQQRMHFDYTYEVWHKTKRELQSHLRWICNCKFCTLSSSRKAAFSKSANVSFISWSVWVWLPGRTCILAPLLLKCGCPRGWTQRRAGHCCGQRCGKNSRNSCSKESNKPFGMLWFFLDNF